MSEALLLSGGHDSIALAWWRRPAVTLTIDYGQAAAEGEIRASVSVAAALGIRHEVIRVDCSTLGSGDLSGRPALSTAPVSEWWPYRNQLLVTLAAMRAIALNVRRLLIGTVATDHAHADGTPAFVHGLNCLLALQEGALELEAPAIALSTVDLIRQSGVPREVLAWAHSCHTNVFACGSCRGCLKHLGVLRELAG